jgi:glycosyltransferase involved in cell wall biosynthesis
MRIALVVTGGVDRSGRERVIPALLWLIERLARRHEVIVYVLHYLERPVTYVLLGATVRDLGRPEGLRRQHAALMAALRADGPFDIIHAYWALPAGFVASAAGRRLGIPTLTTLDSGEFVAIPEIGYGLQRSWRQRLALTATIRLSSQLTVCTDYQARLAQAHGAMPIVMPIGVDCSQFTRRPAPDGPPWRLLHAANLNPVKDQPTLLRAFQQVQEQLGDIHLDIVGHDTLAGAMQRLARDLGLDSHVTFHGFLPTDALVPLYQRAHLCVLSSRHEAAGIVVLEAAACGVATVGPAVGYLADWAPDRAVAVPPATPHALAGAILELLRHPAQRARIAGAAHTWTLAHDADWTAQQLERLYTRLVTETR